MISKIISRRIREDLWLWGETKKMWREIGYLERGGIVLAILWCIGFYWGMMSLIFSGG